MLKLLTFLGLLVLCHAGADPDSEYEYGLFGSPSIGRSLGPRIVQQECKVEMVTIVRTNCKVEFDEECTTEEKVVGDKVTYDRECEEKEVEECKPVHYIPRSGLGGYAPRPSKLESECEKVMKMVCKDIPKKEEVMKDVEICVKTPKETCEEGEQLAPTTTCEKVKH
eukprot:GFUD01088731.1.p1 GENE.GFUD01088731.1~~GFUD01088731.1.p1  ORF type:complete len:167 (-),score=61.72 GFUD01088731.1:144-644(-)